MSAYPTCPTHGLLKPCQHCDLPKPPVARVCGDVEQGDELEACTCGNLRAKGRAHGHTNRRNYDPYDCGY